jgi:protein-S-isoprenylcysteine O-methyltransferase Ste14
MKLKILVGSGRKIGLFTLPFLIAGLTLNLIFPDFFSAGGPSTILIWFSIIMLIPGIIVWFWTVYLILTKIPRKELIINGPYSIVKHPLYTGVALLVIPWVGLLCNSWLGIFLGFIVYIGSRIYSPEEERILAKIFGENWDKYCRKVMIKWL